MARINSEVAEEILKEVKVAFPDIYVGIRQDFVIVDMTLRDLDHNPCDYSIAILVNREGELCLRQDYEYSILLDDWITFSKLTQMLVELFVENLEYLVIGD